MAGLIERHDPIDFTPDPAAEPFTALSRSIVFQQISGAAGSAIYGRYLGLFGGDTPTPEQLLQKSIEELRSVGLSNAKAKAITDLAAKRMEGIVPDADGLNALSDEEVIERLTQVWGVGRWTAEMYLMFTLGREDVLPLNDIGLLNGAQVAFGLRKRPDAKKFTRLAKPWKPFRTTACWYLWKAADVKELGV